MRTLLQYAVRKITSVTLLLFNVGWATACGDSRIAEIPQVTALTHVAVVPMNSERVLEDHTVLVIGDSIAVVAPSGQARVPRSATVIDGSGKFLAPGLVDSHTHVETVAFANALQLPLSDPIPFERVLLPYLAHGVTSIRVLAGAPDLLAARDRVGSGALLGPTLMVASPMLDGNPPVLPPPITHTVESPDSARQAVRTYAAQRYDLIKVRSGLSRDVYDAIVEEARAVSMDVDGHVPRTTDMTIEHALMEGQQGVAHLEEFFYAAGQPDSSTAVRLARVAATGRVRVTTTLTVYPTILAQLRNLDSVLAQPEIADMYPLVVDAFWRRPGNPYLAGKTMDTATLRAGLDFQRMMLRALVDAGVPVLAGSDALNPTILPGKGLWQELLEIEAAGLSPYRTLRTATVVPAEQFPPFARRGIVAPGYRADLILLRRSPLESVENLTTIEGTMVGGRWLPVEELRARIRQFSGDP